jgi:hypothetical protein
MSILKRLLQGSVLKLTRAACVFALLGLSLMAYSLIDPRALQVIVAMSLGHAFGFAAFGCYLIAIVLDVRRTRAESASDAQRDSKR